MLPSSINSTYLCLFAGVRRSVMREIRLVFIYSARWTKRKICWRHGEIQFRIVVSETTTTIWVTRISGWVVVAAGEKYGMLNQSGNKNR